MSMEASEIPHGILYLGDGGSPGPIGPPGPSSSSTTSPDALRLMSLFTTSTQMVRFMTGSSDANVALDATHSPHETTDPAQIASTFLGDLRRVANKIALNSKPDGSRMYPARSCRDIADYYPQKLNGSSRRALLLAV